MGGRRGIGRRDKTPCNHGGAPRANTTGLRDNTTPVNSSQETKTTKKASQIVTGSFNGSHP